MILSFYDNLKEEGKISVFEQKLLNQAILAKMELYVKRSNYSINEILESMNIPTNFYTPPIETVIKIIRTMSDIRGRI